MSMKRLFKGGGIASEDSADASRAADVLVEGDRIIRVAPNLERTARLRSHRLRRHGSCCRRCSIVHVHAREPGQEQKETIATCSEAAINGGVTGFVMMPNTAPAIDSAGVVKTVLECRGAAAAFRFTRAARSPRAARARNSPASARMKAAGAVMITDDGFPVGNPVGAAPRDGVCARLRPASSPVIARPWNSAARARMHEGSVSYSLGLEGIPAISEEICLDRDIRLAQYTGAHIHIQHVTTARGMETIRRCKERGRQGHRRGRAASPDLQRRGHRRLRHRTTR